MPLLEGDLIWLAGWPVPHLAPWPIPTLLQLGPLVVNQVRLHDDVSLTGYSTANYVHTLLNKLIELQSDSTTAREIINPFHPRPVVKPFQIDSNRRHLISIPHHILQKKRERERYIYKTKKDPELIGITRS
jgi:hypothetical protein